MCNNNSPKKKIRQSRNYPTVLSFLLISTLRKTNQSMVSIHTFAAFPDPHTPKRELKYTLIWCATGTVEVIVDGKHLLLHPQQVLTITSGQIFHFREPVQSEGYVLQFSLSFFCKDDHDIELIFHNGLFCHFDMNEVIPVVQAAVLQSQLQLIRDELLRQPYQYLLSVHARIALILVTINREKIARGDEIWKPDALFLKFLELVRGSFEKNHTVETCARQLHTTVAKLNEQAKIHTGKTAQHVIHDLIVSEARRLLLYQQLTVKEVAYQLGFNDPFYFSNFFKKFTGESPKAFQQQNRL